jgi:hypothetical protein
LKALSNPFTRGRHRVAAQAMMLVLVVSGRVTAALTGSIINVVMPDMSTTITKICADDGDG